MFINLDKDYSTYCLSESRPLVYKMKSSDQKLQLKQFIIVIWNYGNYEIALSNAYKSESEIFFVL